MEDNPYNPYDQTPTGQRPKEESLYENPVYYAHPTYSATGGGQQGAAKPARMSKAETLELVKHAKNFLLLPQ